LADVWTSGKPAIFGAWRGQVLKGVDVALERKHPREHHHGAEKFNEVAERYLASNGRDNVSWGETRRLIERDAMIRKRGFSIPEDRAEAIALVTGRIL
jgi:hypothetical protein